jgi:hypothetical protein
LTFGTIAIEVKTSDTITMVKTRIRVRLDFLFRGSDVEVPAAIASHHTLTYEGKILDDGLTLSNYNIQKEDTLHSVWSLSGGAKKGCKKQTKSEKMHLLVAKMHYTTTQKPMAHPSVAGLCQNMCMENYIPTRIANMSLAQITALDDVAQESNRSTVLLKTITPEFIPEYKQLLEQKVFFF